MKGGGGQVWRLGEGSESQACQEIPPESRQEKVKVVWQERSDWKPSVPLKLQHPLLQSFDVQSLRIDRLVQDVT